MKIKAEKSILFGFFFTELNEVLGRLHGIIVPS